MQDQEMVSKEIHEGGFSAADDNDLEGAPPAAKKSRSATRYTQCAYCFKDIISYGHYNHEQSCQKKFTKVVKDDAMKMTQHAENNSQSPESAIVQNEINPYSDRTKCNFCQRAYANHRFSTHTIICKNFEKFCENGLTCKLCKRSFSKRPALFEHIEKIHKTMLEALRVIQSPETKQDDKETTLSPKKVDHHDHDDNHEFGCKGCRKSFRLSIELQSHEKLCLKQCQYCKLALSEDNFAAHEVECKDLIIFIKDRKCLICERIFTKTSITVKHVKEKHKEEVKKVVMDAKTCKNCGETFQLKIELNQHVKKCSNKCQYCSQPFSKSDIIKHEEICSKSAIYIKDKECLICHKEFQVKSEVFAHISKDHNDTINAKFTCQKCNQSFDLEAKLNDHQNHCSLDEIPDIEEPDDLVPLNNSFETKQCSTCQDLISVTNFKAHSEFCAKSSKYILDDNRCNICDITCKSKRDTYIHVRKAHGDILETQEEKSDEVTVVEEALAATNPLASSSLNHETSNFPQPMISSIQGYGGMGMIVKRDPNYIMEINPNAGGFISHHQGFPMFQSDVDPRIVTKLFTCPICLGKLASLSDAKDHIERFHRINQQHQERMGLKLTEELV